MELAMRWATLLAFYVNIVTHLLLITVQKGGAFLSTSIVQMRR